MRLRKNLSNQGFTLPELMMSAMITVIAFMGILYTYARYLELDEISRNTGIALQTVQNKIEAIKNTDYDLIYATFHNQTFTTTGINGRGVTTIDNSNGNLMLITVTFCWRQSNGRRMGEDTNLNGVLNTGEDANGNGSMDSPVQLIAYIYHED
jgi:prepilin-type N-terminal cleavage/methylation domain-containing protein